MFLNEEAFATVVQSTPLISIDLIVENAQGEFLLGKRTNRPAQGFWFVPGGRVQKDEPLAEAFARLTQAELGLSLPMTAGRFYGVWQHFYDDNFSGTDFSGKSITDACINWEDTDVVLRQLANAVKARRS